MAEETQLYSVGIFSFDDPGNDYYDKTVRMTKAQAEVVKAKLVELANESIIYDDYVCEPAGQPVPFEDLDEYLQTYQDPKDDE